MNYPTNLKLSILESTHPDYDKLLPVWNEIDLLSSGGHRLKKAIKSFLPQRPGEDAETYEYRLNKFTYLNLIASTLGDMTSKMANGSLTVSNADTSILNSFRESTNLSGRDEKTLLNYILREILKFKTIFLHVDKTKSQISPINKAQEDLLNIKPYVTTYSPFEVVSWSEQKGKLEWIKVRQVVVDNSNPLATPTTKVIWTFIDNQYVTRYEISDVEFDRFGKVSKIDGEYINEDTTVSLSESVAHNLGEIPVIKVELPDELWVTDQAAAKALEHLRIDCSKYDLLTFAYFQRTYKKVQTPDSALDES